MLNTIWIYVWLYTYVSLLEMQGQRTSFAHSHIKMPFVDFVYNVAKSVPCWNSNYNNLSSTCGLVNFETINEHVSH